jgi:hypothetical protein
MMSNHAKGFEGTQTGSTPGGWEATLTGSGNPKWTLESDQTSPSSSYVIKQSGRATFPLLLKNDYEIKDDFVEVQFKAIDGSQDRAGGLVWRTRDANNYYVVRANALEDNSCSTNRRRPPQSARSHRPQRRLWGLDRGADQCLASLADRFQG